MTTETIVEYGGKFAFLVASTVFVLFALPFWIIGYVAYRMGWAQ